MCARGPATVVAVRDRLAHPAPTGPPAALLGLHDALSCSRATCIFAGDGARPLKSKLAIRWLAAGHLAGTPILSRRGWKTRDSSSGSPSPAGRDQQVAHHVHRLSATRPMIFRVHRHSTSGIAARTYGSCSGPRPAAPKQPAWQLGSGRPSGDPRFDCRRRPSALRRAAPRACWGGAGRVETGNPQGLREVTAAAIASVEHRMPSFVQVGSDCRPSRRAASGDTPNERSERAQRSAASLARAC
jgi:hypothetical protein